MFELLEICAQNFLWDIFSKIYAKNYAPAYFCEFKDVIFFFIRELLKYPSKSYDYGAILKYLGFVF